MEVICILHMYCSAFSIGIHCLETLLKRVVVQWIKLMHIPVSTLLYFMLSDTVSLAGTAILCTSIPKLTITSFYWHFNCVTWPNVHVLEVWGVLKVAIKDLLLKQKFSCWNSDGSMCWVNQVIYTLTVLCCQNLITAPVRRNAYLFSDTGQFNESVIDKDDHLDLDLTLVYETFYISKGVHIMLINSITAR